MDNNGLKNCSAIRFAIVSNGQNIGSVLRLAILMVALFSTAITQLRAQGNQRPLTDFLNAQGQTTCYTYPVKATVGWVSGVGKTNGNANVTPFRFALIDYAGLQAKYLLDHKIDLGTTISGTVTERPLSNGKALVSVELHTQNALGWAFDWDPSNGPPNPVVNTQSLAIGARVPDIILQGRQIAALGDSEFHIQFEIPYPGAPLPDLVAAFAGDPACPSSLFPVPFAFGDIDFLAIRASIKGTLPGGAPAMMTVLQTGLTNPAVGQKGGPLSDGFPVESIDINPLGH
jgi:hypothetical protein